MIQGNDLHTAPVDSPSHAGLQPGLQYIQVRHTGLWVVVTELAQTPSLEENCLFGTPCTLY